MDMGGNILNLTQAMSRILSEAETIVALIQWWDLGQETIQKYLETENQVWGHAGEIETSIAWALGQDVKSRKRKKSFPPISEELRDYQQPMFNPKIPVFIGGLGTLEPKVMKEWETCSYFWQLFRSFPC